MHALSCRRPRWPAPWANCAPGPCLARPAWRAAHRWPGGGPAPRPRPAPSDTAAHQSCASPCSRAGSSATVLTRVPMPGISTSSVSPTARKRGGLRLDPTPSGVPVAMTSPGDSGVKALM
ncbi:hypothetical protein G6F64_014994 [Rhizopus arrhizus]|uniref:Uncharacterized protein n=1 Tax=Rhizopus oryzae TaxID=64495 RepID=A0A9P6WSE4_RHIOR|nr:hypothetical protein G6F64_014994 [Rhizopus arrhizus]